MGQQQLLLLVLATVIVGLATVAGIQAFEQGSVRANQDALTQTAVKIASDAQAKLKEPSQFGGYGIEDMSNFGGGITLSEMGYDAQSSGADYGNSPFYETANGECAITADGSSGNVVDVTCESADNEVVVQVSGLDSKGITTVTQKVKS